MNYTQELNKEKWIDIPGYDGIYQISDLGNVKSLKYNKEIILKPAISGGYYNVVLSKNNIKKTFKIHQLMAIAFFNHTLGHKLVIDHKDSNKLNNNINNLSIISHRDNSRKEKNRIKSEKNGCELHTGVFKKDKLKKYHILFAIKNSKLNHFGYYSNLDQANQLASKILNLIENNYCYEQIIFELKSELSLRTSNIKKILKGTELF